MRYGPLRRRSIISGREGKRGNEETGEGGGEGKGKRGNAGEERKGKGEAEREGGQEGWREVGESSRQVPGTVWETGVGGVSEG